MPGGRHAQHRAAIEAAVAAGVRHIVYTSGPAARPDPDLPIPDDHFWTEQALAASPIGWTALRNHIYAEIALRGLPQAIASGQLMSATAGGGRSYVTREDCARTAVAALVSGFDGRRILDVTGPAPVTQVELAALASEITGKTVRHVDVAPEDLRKGLVAAGLPPIYAGVIVGFDVDAAQGYHAISTRVVETLTGTAPTSLRAFLEANREALTASA